LPDNLLADPCGNKREHKYIVTMQKLHEEILTYGSETEVKLIPERFRSVTVKIFPKALKR